VGDLVLGQIVAIAMALLFCALEYLRFRLGGQDRPLIRAIAEAMRMWGYIAASELTLWAASGATDPLSRALIAAVGMVVTLIVVNNAYGAYHRAQIAK